MGKNYMAVCADEFVDKIKKIELNAQTFSEIDEKRERIVGKNGLLASFAAKSNELKAKNVSATNKANNVERQLNIVLDRVDNNIAQWKRQIEEYAKGVRFVEKYQKYFVVMVFGPVKAGKSTLGNFFGGTSYRNADFANEFKKLPQPQRNYEEEARKEDNSVNNAEEIFPVGILDTTGNMQYFTMFKLCWMDTPGLGALGKEGDKRKMDEMVDGYIKYADMCIFVINSSEPGLTEELKYMSRLSDEERDALVVITKSDDLCRDRNSRYYRMKTAKTDTKRTEQEEDLKDRLKKDYPDINIEKYSIFSISTELAENAIKNNDDELFKSSNLDKLMLQLGQACDKAAERKVKLPKQAFNGFISEILKGKEADENRPAFMGIDEIKSEIAKISSSAQKYKKQIAQKEDSILHTTKMKIKTEINKTLEKLADEVRRSNKKIEQKEILNEVNQIINTNLDNEVNKAMANIIEGYQKQPISIKDVNFETGNLENQTDTITTKYTVTNLEVRAPEGILEHIGDFLGWKYYKRVSQEEEIKRVIDLGPNIAETSEKVINGVEKEIKIIIKEELNRLKESYFAPQEAYAKEMGNLLNKLEADLKSLKE